MAHFSNAWSGHRTYEVHLCHVPRTRSDRCKPVWKAVQISCLGAPIDPIPEHSIKILGRFRTHTKTEAIFEAKNITS